MNNIEFDVEEPGLKEFLEQFSEKAKIRYEALGLAGHIAVVSRNSDGMFEIFASEVNTEHGRHGWGGNIDVAIGRGISTLKGEFTRDYVNVVNLSDNCTICSVSTDCKGYPERDDARDLEIITSVLEEISLEQNSL